MAYKNTKWEITPASCYHKKTLIIKIKFSKSVKIILFLTLIVSISIGCSTSRQPKQQQFGIGIRLSSSNPPLKEKDPGTKYNYKLKSNDSFKGTFQLENVRPKKHNYLILAFLDHLQVPFFLDGKKDRSHKVTIGPYKNDYWSVKTMPVNKGFHDFFTIVIWDPEIHLLKEDFRIETDFNFIAASRVNFLSSERLAPPKVKYTSPMSRFSQGKKSSLPTTTQEQNAYDGVRINKIKDGLDFWLKEEVNQEEKIDYFVHLANNTKKTKYYALITLIDFNQIPMEIGGKPVIYAKIKPNEVQTFQASFNAPKSKGIHELLVIRAENPFLKLGLKSESKSIIEPSIRVPIVVN